MLSLPERVWEISKWWLGLVNLPGHGFGDLPRQIALELAPLLLGLLKRDQLNRLFLSRVRLALGTNLLQKQLNRVGFEYPRVAQKLIQEDLEFAPALHDQFLVMQTQVRCEHFLRKRR